MDEAFARTTLLLGEEGLERLKRSRVAVVGIGGVGSFVVEALTRCGIGGFLLVDHDTVQITNLNRQIHATRATIGLLKVEAMRERILQINPVAEVEAISDFLSSENVGEILKSGLSYVVDAIDTVSSKLALISEAKRLGIPILSSMGAGNKLNPSLFEVADISATSVCPLARVMRRELRRRGIESLTVVYSKEMPLKPKNPQEEGSATTGKRPPGSVSFVPSAAGLLIASVVVQDILSLSRKPLIHGSVS